MFDDRDFAGRSTFPALSPTTSFPYTPVLEPGEQNLKVPAWLNDVTLYHNRGDTTFVGEDSLYGDFFGLDDLFTEHPRVVRGMIDIYKAWIRDFGVDGFRIDTMKHVDDGFWQQFGPEVLAYARAHGKREFFMFGEVFDTTKSFTSHFTTQDRMQAVIDFPFQAAAQGFAADAKPADALKGFFEDDDWYTDADSNVYQLPTFLGNHDMGRIGFFVARANRGATDAELLARDRLAHELMYFSRGNPVIYYGDEQGFTGDRRRPGRAPDAVPEPRPRLPRRRPDRHRRDARAGQLRARRIRSTRRSPGSRALTERHDALRDGAHQHRYAEPGGVPGVYAFSRLDRREQREYVVALNNAETAKTAAIPTYVERRPLRADLRRRPEPAAHRPRPAADRHRAAALRGRLQARRADPEVASRAVDRARRAGAGRRVARPHGGPRRRRRRLVLRGDVPRQGRRGDWTPIGTDDTAPYRVFHDVSGLRAGTPVHYRAVVLDNRGHTRTSRTRSAQVPPPALTWDVPRGGLQAARRACCCGCSPTPSGRRTSSRSSAASPAARGRRSGRDSSSPAYSLRDDFSGAGAGHGHDDRLPGDAHRAGRDAGDERGARRSRSRRRRSTTAIVRYWRADRRLRRTGACTCGATRSPRGARRSISLGPTRGT